jgi:hypothetical protein
MLACALVECATCKSNAPPSEQAQEPKAAVPPEIQLVAQAALGNGAEVLAMGNLSQSGDQEVLAVNPIKEETAKGPGVLISRAVVVGNAGGKWAELFRCDEYLKNPQGYLVATPTQAVSSWRLQFSNTEQGLAMYFTPVGISVNGAPPRIGVRWNPKLKRYQSLDRFYKNFLGERASLEAPQVKLTR